MTSGAIASRTTTKPSEEKASVRAGIWRGSVVLHPEQVAPPLGQKVDEEHQQHGDQDSSAQHQPPREVTDLLLSRDGALLQLQRTLRHPPVLRELLALRVANLAQELSDLVAAIHARYPP